MQTNSTSMLMLDAARPPLCHDRGIAAIRRLQVTIALWTCMPSLVSSRLNDAPTARVKQLVQREDLRRAAVLMHRCIFLPVCIVQDQTPWLGARGSGLRGCAGAVTPGALLPILTPIVVVNPSQPLPGPPRSCVSIEFLNASRGRQLALSSRAVTAAATSSSPRVVRQRL